VVVAVGARCWCWCWCWLVWVRYNYPDAPHNIGGILLKSSQRSQSLVNLKEYTILIADDMSDELGSTAFKFLTCIKLGSW
jgi:hypothetical protein